MMDFITFLMSDPILASVMEMGPVTPFLPALGGIAGGLAGGSKGPSSQTTSQEASVPRQLLPGFNTGMDASANQFNQAGGQNENFNQPLSRNLIGQTLAGQFLDPNNNPGLQGVLDRGGDFIQNRLNTDFASSGRDLNAARPAAADALGTFTSNTLFNNFNAERGRQQSALGQVNNFDPLNQFLDRFSSLGQSVTNQSATSPLYKDRLAGGIGGLQAGSAAGGSIEDIINGLSNSGGQGSTLPGGVTNPPGSK